MFIINDMELLARLGKYKILSNILPRFSISISAIRLGDYSYMLKKEIQIHSLLTMCYPDDGFDMWVTGKRENASIGDLSSIYLAKTQDLSIVLSNEDTHLEHVARAAEVLYITFDDFILRTVQDQYMVQIYNLIKAA